MRTFLVGMIAALMVALLARPALAAAAADPTTLRVALLPDENPNNIIRINEPLKRYLERSLGKTIELVVTTDYSSMIEAMRFGKLELGYFGPLSYVLLREKMGREVIPFAAKLENGSPTYHSVVIAGRTTAIRALADIRGKTVAYGDPASTSSHLIPKQMLQEAGLRTGVDYREHFAGAHDAVAMAVQNGHAQAGGLSQPIFESLGERKMVSLDRVEVVATSKPYPNYPWALRTSLNPALQEKIVQGFLALKDPAVLRPIKAEGFGRITDQDYDVIRDMVRLLNLDLAKAK
jgi:phosphonate transport system substrate-binding protein